MKTRVLLFAAAVLLGIIAAVYVVRTKRPSADPSKSAGSVPEKQIQYWTCSMHPQIKQPDPGHCPICHMELVPVYKETSSEGGQSRGVLITPERQQLIGVKVTKVERKRAHAMVHTSGRVAFDPDLAVAVREFVQIARHDPALRGPAISRLRLLGMGNEEIARLESGAVRGDDMFLPVVGGSVWVYATVYENEISAVKTGMAADVASPSDSDKVFRGVVRSVAPVVDPVTRSIRVRIEVPGSGGVLRPDAFVDVKLHADLGQGLVIPSSALVDTGMRQIVYVRNGDRFEQREVRVRAEVEGGLLIERGLKEGEIVVNGATFMVDSESQLRGTEP